MLSVPLFAKGEYLIGKFGKILVCAAAVSAHHKLKFFGGLGQAVKGGRGGKA